MFDGSNGPTVKTDHRHYLKQLAIAVVIVDHVQRTVVIAYSRMAMKKYTFSYYNSTQAGQHRLLTTSTSSKWSVL